MVILIVVFVVVKAFKGFKAAFGPQLWWGANPAVLLKYRKEIGKYHVTGIFHEDVDELSDALTSIAIPLPKTSSIFFALTFCLMISVSLVSSIINLLISY